MSEDFNRQRCGEILRTIWELPDQEREGAILRLCAGDAALEAEVRARLAPPPSGFLERPPSILRGALAEQPVEPQGALGIGHVLDGKYRLIERIGAGSMGEVYRGEHLQLRKPVAVKLLLPSALTPEEVLAPMLREARKAAAVRHENVVAVHDVGVHGGRAYMVMDWVDGVDLQRWLSQESERNLLKETPDQAQVRGFFASETQRPCSGPLWSRPYWEMVAFLMARVARAAECAHASGVVHRDIAPKNVLLTAEGKPYLVDFGVASFSKEGGTEAERGGAAGTLPYMAPEQLEPDGGAGRPSMDVYSIGATLYHLITGRPPFEGTALQILGKIRRDLPPRIRSLQPGVPRDLEAICFAAMEKRPEARYAGAGALASDLEAFLERRPITARPPGVIGRTVRFCQRRPAAAVAFSALGALLVASVLLGTMGWKEVQRQRSQQRWEDFVGLFAKLPALTTLEPDARYATTLILASSDKDLGPTWARLVELQPELPLLRWYRASWCSQWGELDTAREELDALEQSGYGSALLTFLGERMTSPDPVVRNQLAKLEKLPAPVRPFDHVLRGYVAIRWRDMARAWEDLSQAVEEEPKQSRQQWMYRDLRAVAGLEHVSGDLYVEDAALVQAALGQPTCRTLHVRAFLLHKNDAHRAIKLWTECLKLGGDQHQPLHMIGYVLSKNEFFDEAFGEAESYLRRADEIKRGFWRTAIALSRCAELKENFEQAQTELLAGLENLPVGHPVAPARDLRLELAYVHMLWAEKLAVGGDLPAARQHLGESRATLDQVAAEEPEADYYARIELEVVTSSIDVTAGEIAREEAIGKMRSLHLSYVQAAGEDSDLIQERLGKLLFESTEERERAEGETLLLLSDPKFNPEPPATNFPDSTATNQPEDDK